LLHEFRNYLIWLHHLSSASEKVLFSKLIGVISATKLSDDVHCSIYHICRTAFPLCLHSV